MFAKSVYTVKYLHGIQMNISMTEYLRNLSSLHLALNHVRQIIVSRGDYGQMNQFLSLGSPILSLTM